MTDDNKIENSLKPISSTGLARVGNFIEITKKILKENDERSKAELFKCIKIGNQEWMAKNLDVSCYNNGDSIPHVDDHKKWRQITTGAWCYPKKNNSKDNYGKLYNYHAVRDKRGLIPDGFRLPNKSDFEILGNFLENDFDEKNDNETNKYSLVKSLNKFNIGHRLGSGEYIQDDSHFWADHFNHDETCGVAGFWMQVDEDKNYFCTFFLEGYSEHCGFSVWLIRNK